MLRRVRTTPTPLECSVESSPLILQKTPPPQVHDDQSLVPFLFPSTNPAPKPWRKPRLAPAQALPTGGDDNGDRRALAVPYECGDLRELPRVPLRGEGCCGGSTGPVHSKPGPAGARSRVLEPGFQREHWMFFRAVIFSSAAAGASLRPTCYCRAVVILSANTSPFVVAA